MDEELQWAASRPGSCWPVGNPPRVATRGIAAFEDCLTAVEKKWLDDYQKIQGGSIYSLNQNPEFRCMTAKGEARFVLFRDMCLKVCLLMRAVP